MRYFCKISNHNKVKARVMSSKFLRYLVITLQIFLNTFRILEANEICNQTMVPLNDEFMSCCQGKPTFVSEPCVDKMMQNHTLSQECVVECMYKSEFGIYNGKDIDLDVMGIYLENHLSELDIREMFVNGFTKCHAFGREHLLELFETAEMRNEHGCDSFPAYMDRCIWYHTLSHCPERLGRAHADKCAEKITWVRQCIFN